MIAHPYSDGEMRKDDLINNDDEVNMKIYKITHPEVPGSLNVAAEIDEDADAIFHDWFHARFGRSPMKFMVEDVSASLLIASQLHEAATSCEMPGVAYAVKEHGWIVLPADVEAPGPYHLLGKNVTCYEFSHEVDGSKTTILAYDPGHAWQIYHVWAEHHGRCSDTDDQVNFAQTNSPFLNQPRLVKAIRLGITGVVSRRLSGWDVLPPWDDCAGSI